MTNDDSKRLSLGRVEVERALRDKLPVGFQLNQVWAGARDGDWHLEAQAPCGGHVIHVEFRWDGRPVGRERDSLPIRQQTFHVQQDLAAQLANVERQLHVETRSS